MKTYVYDLGGGIIEFMAIGTAVKKMPGVNTISAQLLPQAIIRDRDTFINTIDTSSKTNLSESTKLLRHHQYLEYWVGWFPLYSGLSLVVSQINFWLFTFVILNY